MKPQYQHKVMTSFLLWFDNFLLTKGEAFSNKTGSFHYVSDSRLPSSYRAFSSPYKQFVNDSSIPGAIVKSGISGFKLPTYQVSNSDDVRSFAATIVTGITSAYFTEINTRFFKVTQDLFSGSENYRNDWVSFEPNYAIQGSGIPSNGEFLRFNQYSSTKFQLYYHIKNASDPDGNPTNEFFKLSPAHPFEEPYPWMGAYNSNSNSEKRIRRFYDPKDVNGDLIDSKLHFINTALLDFENGRIIETGLADYATSDTPTGIFSVKDFNVYLTNETEEDLILESKFKSNSRYDSNFNSGVKPYDQMTPAIFINNEVVTNAPFAFGGEDETRISIKAVVMAEDTYGLDGVLSIFADSARESITVIPFTGHPGTEYGDVDSLMKSGYSYTDLTKTFDGAETKFYIDDVTVSKLSDRAKKQSIGDLKIGFIDFDVHQHRFPRL